MNLNEQSKKRVRIEEEEDWEDMEEQPAKPRKIVKANRKVIDSGANNADVNSDMECEDSQEDEFEQEDVIQNDADSDEAAGDWEDESDDGDEKMVQSVKTQVWNDQKDPIKDDEELEYDGSAYQMLHRSKVEWPCLSVDFLLKERSTA